MIRFTILSDYNSDSPGDAALAFKEVEDAQAKFDELKTRGCMAFKIIPGGKGEKEVKKKVNKIEPDSDYLITPRIAGG